MPSLFILAGANGSGKTTFYFSAKLNKFIDATVAFVNVDMIAREELGGYSSENFESANLIYRERVGGYIDKMEDFMIESNLSKQTDFDWLEKMKQKGYELILLLLGTSDVEINIKRVEKRVVEGGHHVPENIVRDRYDMGMLYMRTKFHLFKEAYLIDNSNETKLIAVIKNNQVEYAEKIIPLWVSRLLYLQHVINEKKST
ncbi:MAG: hypothetical protein ABJA35_10045 [Parafilimonas sp.]